MPSFVFAAEVEYQPMSSSRVVKSQAVKSRARKKSNQLNKNDWFEGGLQALSELGVPGLRTEVLAQRLGVTTGSFYWHFRDRDDFYTQLLNYWSEQMTEQLIRQMEQKHLDARQQLYQSFAQIGAEGLARYETPIRAWAATQSRARNVIAEIDEKRISYITVLMRQLGFKGAELEMRARTLLLCAMAEPVLALNDSPKQRHLWWKLRLDLIAGGAQE